MRVAPSRVHSPHLVMQACGALEGALGVPGGLMEGFRQEGVVSLELGYILDDQRLSRQRPRVWYGASVLPAGPSCGHLTALIKLECLALPFSL